MRTVATVADMRRVRRSLSGTLGFIPTMGALHAGHLSLVERARTECATVVASIFVNPLQFGPNEDFERYPRTPDRDAQALARAGVDVLFAPQRAEMYPPGAQFSVVPGSLATYLEGDRRPGFFTGVATVVLKLFNIVTPDVAYFGQKDAQQLAVVTRMVRDLDVPVRVAACPTVREPDGLALSSRNAYLDDAQRAAAPHLHAALVQIAHALEGGQRDVCAAVAQAEAALPPLKMDYLAVVDPAVFEPLRTAPGKAALLAVGAAFAGSTRLIDNVEVQTP
ncbi:MAG: pantoate--beta-alanine ligase [Candidatus Eremiobacteraeota bacterium]|nr:pantoate--beta-alanine ligase [Candidatus Eremiobacteraeota bacterium]MBV8366390.1 pantoate--beta-alanine ligase [Candidatus Eremiobacteraeota bacterium]